MFLRSPVRIHPIQSHITIYTISDDGNVFIIRIRHGHEDWLE
ncbi:MAG: type II toxin-antitoxin system RelE/ParE family toxin [Gammaproteobacteria bacterium]|uniref:Type II toxin-antitoxin system RelE/ParE family toxin n=1 Tax=Candidatus Thiopontia autotrophica TaxID=2841688 RepID=A0A8J6TPP7_9GAMM|nr:type II toxin-antitoxin system RelE/ParE family toxin [Candidatus Thiopontia autotrophica]